MAKNTGNMDPSKIEIDCTGAGGFAPFAGIGSSDLLTADGLYKVRLSADALIISEGQKTAGEPCLLAGWDVDPAEDTENGGRRLVNRHMLGGKDKNGQPMIRQAFEPMHSAGVSLEDIHDLEGKKTSAQKFVGMFREAVALGAYARVIARAGAEDGIMRSEIAGWVTQEEYDAAKEKGTHRKPHRVVTGAPGTTTINATAAARAAAVGGGEVPAAIANNNGAAAPQRAATKRSLL